MQAKEQEQVGLKQKKLYLKTKRSQGGKKKTVTVPVSGVVERIQNPWFQEEEGTDLCGSFNGHNGGGEGNQSHPGISWGRASTRKTL